MAAAAAAAAGRSCGSYWESGTRGGRIERGRGTWKQRVVGGGGCTEGLERSVPLPRDPQLCPNSSKQAHSARDYNPEVAEVSLEDWKCSVWDLQITTVNLDR